MNKRLMKAATAGMALLLFLTSCGVQNSGTAATDEAETTVSSDFTVATAGSYDSADTAVVVAKDEEASTLTFLNLTTGRQYTLTYDGTTYARNKYGETITMSKISLGDIVDVTFLKSKKKLASVQQSASAWVYSGVDNYNLVGINKTATIASGTYSLSDEAVVFSDGKRADVSDIVSQDVLTISGIGHEIYSIVVEKGHGYLKLTNDDALVGGWIEVGSKVIRRITENMLLVVPEGSYQVALSNGNVSCTKDVVIDRNKEVILDVGDLEIEENKTGFVLFSVDPSTATVKVDGTEIDISQEVELSYGIHQVKLSASGYTSMTKYIQVGAAYASLHFEMEEAEDGEESDTEDIDTTDEEDEDEDITDVASAGERVYIDAPLNTEVYLDGNYMGITPVNFAKSVGSHVITLAKSGYISKSYTVYLYDDGEDITYSFMDLEPEESETDTEEETEESTDSEEESDENEDDSAENAEDSAENG